MAYDLKALFKTYDNYIIFITIFRLNTIFSFEDVRLQRFAPETLIAFTAVKVASQNDVARNQNIMFENVPLNEGNGFNLQRGVFIATKQGVFMFTVNLVHVNQPNPFHAALVHNGNVIVKLHGESNTWDQTSQTVYLTLAPGDEVYVRNIDFDHETIYGDNYSSFSGMLVWEL